MKNDRLLPQLVRRLASALLVTWLAISGVFLLVHGVGDPAVATLGGKASPADLAAFRERHGLDQPLWKQYGQYLGGLLQGDLGSSYRDGRPVTEVIGQRLPRTLLLGGLALVFELGIGLGLGVLAALWKGRWPDHLAMGLAYLGVSLPTFVTGLILLYWVGFRFGALPLGGYGVGLADQLRHAVLPALTLAVFGAATYARLIRGELLDVLCRDHVRFAQARGLGASRIVLVHGLRPALLPIVALVGLQMGALVSGAIITEQVFAWPGMGRLAYESLHTLDLPIVLGIVVVSALVVQGGNLVADLSLGALDPRLRPTSD